MVKLHAFLTLALWGWVVSLILWCFTLGTMLHGLSRPQSQCGYGGKEKNFCTYLQSHSIYSPHSDTRFTVHNKIINITFVFLGHSRLCNNRGTDRAVCTV